MCGITGYWRPRGLEQQATSLLAKMMTRLRHRGPDATGQHIDHDYGIAMGHTRLSIIDLSSTGNQPIVSPDQKLALTVNGEFYDYKTTRAVFACHGERFETKTDSEIALKLYQQRGLAFVEALRGEFAIALFDAERRRLVLVRDRFGVRPLFYHFDGESLYWGSEVKALLAHPATPKKLCPRAALNQMMQTMVPGTSAFEGIEALEPGQMLVAEQEGDRLKVQCSPYWDVDFPRAEEYERDPDPKPYIEGVTEQMIDAVRVRLEADVPVGCYLSGGIDSCSILGLATAMQQSPVKAFTISFDHDAYDEASIATQMALSTRADQEVLELSAADLYEDSYARTLWHAERTFYNTLGVAKWHMSRRVRECGFKVVVTGEGSDELFAGYPFLKRDYYLHAEEVREQQAQLSRELDESNAVFKGAILSERSASHPAFDELLGFTPSWIQPWLLTLEQVRPLFSREARAAQQDYDPVAAIAAKLDPEQIEGRHPLDRAQYSWIKTMLEGQILNWGGDRVDMANSMESRPPFLDHQLAAYTRTIPPSLRIRGGVEKWVLREAMQGVLPEVLYKRQKFAFMAPPAYTDIKKREAIDRLISQWMGTDQVADVGLFDASAVAAFLERYRKQHDPVAGFRNDIILNHLLGLHVIAGSLL
jgi:asparagine synthase (glutamine-hydrolysing)